MYCNYCRALNPNDAAYCSACGRTISRALNTGEAETLKVAKPQGVRPLSISIIGWFCLIGSVFGALLLLSNSSLLPGKQLPLFFWGFFFFGASAYLIYIALKAAGIVAAVGLLKLRQWGLFLAISLQCLAVVNIALLLVIPANRSRFQQSMDTMFASRTHTPAPFPFPIWKLFAIQLVPVFVTLWFLITRKQAFTRST